MARQNQLVYEEWASILVPSAHGSGIHYRVFYGTVNWTGDPTDLRKAVVVFMQYGSAADWTTAISANEIALQMPAHILVEDIDAVLKAISQVRHLP